MDVGIGVGDLVWLTLLKERGYLHSCRSVIEIGAQQVNESLLGARTELDALGRQFGATGPCPLLGFKATSTQNDSLAGYPLARDLWTWLGIDYSSIDLDESPGAIPLDLNYDEVPEPLTHHFDLVTNLGTTEHVANQLQAFKIVHDLCALHGCMVHAVPSQGMMNHGLFGYNMKFFWTLARSNGYKVVHMDATLGDNQEVSSDIIHDLAQYTPDFAARFREYRPKDCGALAIFQKTFDTPYVAPIDIKTGTQTNIQALKERYWSVFNADAFARLPEVMPRRN